MEKAKTIKDQLEKVSLRQPPYWDYRYLKNVEKLSKPLYEVKKERNVFVAVHDGTKLCLDIFRPDGDGNFPALVAWGGYGKELQSMDISPQPWESYVFNMM
jgi:predicted acyl esterase